MVKKKSQIEHEITDFSTHNLGPVHMHPDVFETDLQHFLSGLKFSPSTHCQICCIFIIFHSGERIKKYLDSLDACGRKLYQERKCCGSKNIQIGVDRALDSVNFVTLIVL